MLARARHQRRETLDERERVEDKVGGAVTPGTAQGVDDLALGGERKALPGNGGASHVAAQVLEALAVVRFDVHLRVQRETIDGGSQRGRLDRSGILRASAETLDAPAGIGSEGDARRIRLFLRKGETRGRSVAIWFRTDMEPDTTPRPSDLLEHSGWLRALARHLVSDPSTADDVVQMTLVTALERPERPREGVRAWLAGVARNVARQLGRSEARRTVRERRGARREALPSAEEMSELVETQRTLSAAVLELAESYRTVVFLRYFEGLAPSEIALRIGVPASTVRVRLKRALATLRQRLNREYGGHDRAWALALLPLALPSRGEALATTTGMTGALFQGTIAMSTQFKLALAAGVAIGASALLWTQRGAAPGIPSEATAVASSTPEPVGPGTAPGTSTPSVEDARAVVPPAPADRSMLLGALATDECCIVGRVRDDDGTGIGGARVEAVDGRPVDPRILVVLEEQQPELLAVTDVNGRYEIGVPQNRAFLLRVTHDAFAPGTVCNAFAGERRDVTLERGATLTVTIVAGTDGAPIAGGEVRVRSVQGFGTPTAWSLSSVTNEAGVAVFPRIPPGALHASVAAEGYATGLWRMNTEGAEDLEHEFRLALESVVTGVVLDASTEAPVPDAKIEAGNRTARTDHNGRFRIGRFAASEQAVQSVVAEAAGYAPEVVYARLPEAGTNSKIVLRLCPEARVVGRVVDELGSPIADAAVAFRGKFSTNPFTAEVHRGEVVTNGHGRFELAGVHPTGQYALAAQARGYAPTNALVGPLGEGGEELDLGDVVLARGGSISGEVRGRTHDADAPDTVVANLVLGDQRTPVASTLVSPHDTFLLGSLAPGVYELELYGWDDERGLSGEAVFARRTVALESAEARRDVVLTATAPIRGRVMKPDGNPANARITLHRAEGKSAIATVQTEGGEFEIQTEDRGPYFVVASDPALFFDPASRDGVLAGTDGLELRLRSRDTGHSITGRITDAEGDPVTTVYVHFTDVTTGARISRVGIPDDRGWFELENLDDTTYDLKIVDFDDRFEPVARDGVAPGGEPVQFLLVRRL